MTTELVIKPLKNAYHTQQPDEGLVNSLKLLKNTKWHIPSAIKIVLTTKPAWNPFILFKERRSESRSIH